MEGIENMWEIENMTLAELESELATTQREIGKLGIPNWERASLEVYVNALTN